LCPPLLTSSPTLPLHAALPIYCPEECQNFPFRGYGFKDPAPAFKGEVSSGDPPQSFPGMPSYTPSPYSSPDLGVDIIKCFFRHDVSVIGSPSPDHRV